MPRSAAYREFRKTSIELHYRSNSSGLNFNPSILAHVHFSIRLCHPPVKDEIAAVRILRRSARLVLPWDRLPACRSLIEY
jgi:hypothetical protein